MAKSGLSPAHFQPSESISPQRRTITIFRRNPGKPG